ncbi:MAG: porphyrin biosynthesis protein [Brevundimonas sp.]|nr:porphyrin biosynthesis protein [Brevundimonas sp.]
MPARSDLTTAQLSEYLTNQFGPEINAENVRSACDHFGVTYATATKRLRDFYVKRGTWNLTVQERLEQTYQAPAAAPAVMEAVEQNLIPSKDENYVPFGNFSDVKKIIQSRIFYPTFITGMSGNGKTFSVEQACAALNRELIRVNITIETDEDDLIGGFRLVNGETVWHNGPVIEALERGAVLLLDEVDLASNKILCLQSVLEGKGVFLKKTGRYVQPAPGFNVIATANTKGKGSDDGRFIGTNVLNEAFLERFALTFEQEYPTPAVESKILLRVAASVGKHDEEFCNNLANWADIIRRTFKDGGIDEVISTRRLVHIMRAYAIWGDRMKAIKVCVNRFDDETKQSFIELYDKIDADVSTEEEDAESND